MKEILKSVETYLSNITNSKNIYLDYNAMSLVRPEILSVVQDMFSLYGNPFAAHFHGREMKSILNLCKENLAECIDCSPNEIYFTSGASEANNIAILGMKNHVTQYIFGATEHESVLNTIHDHKTVQIINGEVDLNQLENLLKNSSVSFVSIMVANNETGIITKNIKEAINLTHKYNGIFHTDGVQSIGKMDISFRKMEFDMMSVSSLKSGGIIGVGALIKSSKIQNCSSLMFGKMENSLKPGTPAVPLIIGFERSVAIARENLPIESKKYTEMREKFETILKSNGAIILGENTERIPNTTYCIMPEIDQSEQVMMFDMRGISVSAGSACYKTRYFCENFMKSVCVNEQTYRSGVRFSMGFCTKLEELITAADLWKEIKNSI
ncbi:cysteine desulfurase family protein [Candidatus Gromoviella agglomerans]|uniref:cysteine desulfurase family protein n=1 Tax=Candidatus Gromoviella agglomerans TaxID=2806609 RepID=UPI001E602838|nr:aminotransferase class V-fold PLP-dependent enzyme [Candidatus Gromoviella agglomerans]UFX98519.1 Cysteine desulfurase [Candidatus Gromoviella agglomerans]